MRFDALEVVFLPSRKHTIGNKWVAIKDWVIGQTRCGIDYEETLAPTAKITSVQTLLALPIIQDWEMCQINVKNVFITGNLCEKYMDQPPSYVSLILVWSPT